MVVDMSYWKERIDEMTPDERFKRVVEILTKASVRLLEKQRAAAEGAEPTPEPESPEKQPLDFTSPEVPLEPPCRGRVPFGQRKSGEDRKIHEFELSLIRDIQQLAAEGLSSEQIAQWLNQEDKVSKRAGKWSRTAVWRIQKSLKA
jgi:hypothetical protein